MNSIGFGAYNGLGAITGLQPITTVELGNTGNKRPVSRFSYLRGAQLKSGHTIHYHATYKRFYIKNVKGKVVRKGMSGTIHVPGLFQAGSQWASRNKPPAEAAAEKKETEKKLEEAKASGDAAAMAALNAQIAALTELQAAQAGKTDVSGEGLDKQTLLLLGGGAILVLVVVMMMMRGGRPAYRPPPP